MIISSHIPRPAKIEIKSIEIIDSSGGIFKTIVNSGQTKSVSIMPAHKNEENKKAQISTSEYFNKPEEKSYKQEIQGKKVQEALPNNVNYQYDMKDISCIIDIFGNFGLTTQDLIQFCEYALKDSRKTLDKINKFDAILESPFISLLLKDKETLGCCLNLR